MVQAGHQETLECQGYVFPETLTVSLHVRHGGKIHHFHWLILENREVEVDRERGEREDREKGLVD